jgi:hypothetical protein
VERARRWRALLCSFEPSRRSSGSGAPSSRRAGHQRHQRQQRHAGRGGQWKSLHQGCGCRVVSAHCSREGCSSASQRLGGVIRAIAIRAHPRGLEHAGPQMGAMAGCWLRTRWFGRRGPGRPGPVGAREARGQPGSETAWVELAELTLVVGVGWSRWPGRREGEATRRALFATPSFEFSQSEFRAARREAVRRSWGVR